ncbi:MAG TPA: hypothetical protein VHL11_05240 [Phototrophicaceae bacterium]|jgi:hypothetical protein|nr:hypothetical protein [Phototrophicaceae bacterium]
MPQPEVIEKINQLKGMLLHRISEDGYEHPNQYFDAYRDLRLELSALPEVQPTLPHFINENLDLREFWRFIRRKYPTYEKRQDYIERAFARTLRLLGVDSE